MAGMKVIVLNRRTAVTRELARRIMRACHANSNPTDLAEELLESKSECFDLLRAQVSSFQSTIVRQLPLIRRWDASGDVAPLELPSFLTIDDRASVHSFCEHRNLKHDTKGDEGNERLVVSQRGVSGGTDANGGDANGGDADAVGVGGDIMAGLSFDELWKLGLIKYDPRHWMGNWFLMAQSKSSALFKYFCVATSDAIFQVWEGDASVPGTRAHVKAHLRKRFEHGVGVNMKNATKKKEEDARVDGLIKRVRRGYWRKHCRFSIAPPRELARRLLAVYYFFRDLDDPETGKPFLSAGHEAICRRELGYVAKGELSDHPTIPLYFELYRLSTGLVISRCLRTSSGLEGYHQHVENAVAKCGKAAGLRWTEAVTNEFDWRWVVRAVRKAKLIPLWVRHYNLSVIEYIHDTAVTLLGEAKGKEVVAGWRRTQLMTTPLVRHGMHYGLEAQKRESACAETEVMETESDEEEAQTEVLSGEGGWVAERMGASQALRHRMEAADVDALLAASGDATAAQLSDIAYGRGLHLPAARAERFIETVTPVLPKPAAVSHFSCFGLACERWNHPGWPGG